MKKLALLGIILLPMLALGVDAFPPSAGFEAPPAARPAGRIASGATQLVSDPAARVEREPIHADTTPTPSTGVAVRGRCVDSSTGRPIAGCRIEARIGLPDGRSVWRAWRPADLAATVCSDPDGSFSIALVEDATLGLTVRVECDGYVGRAGHWSEPTPALDLGELALTPGISVHGRVVDVDSVGLTPSFVLLSRDDSELRSVMAERGSARAVTDIAGGFRCGPLLAPGDYFVVLHGAGSLIEPRRVTIDSGRSDTEIIVTARRPDPAFAIHGDVVDETGAPLAGILVIASGDGSIGRTETDREGRFTAPRADRWHASTYSGVRISTSHGDGEWDQHSPAPETRFDWGQRDVHIVMRQLGSREIVITDEHGAPVEDCTVHVYHAVPGHPVSMAPYPHVDWRGPHEGGRLTVDGIRSGRSAVLVVPGDDTLGSRTVEFDGAAKSGELHVVLPHRGRLRVRVVDTLGAAVAGSRVEVVRLLGVDHMTENCKTDDVRLIDPRATAPIFTALDSSTTDASGEALLHAPPESLWLRATGGDHPAHIEPLEVPRGSLVHRVVVDRGATLEGRLTPNDVIAELEAVRQIVPMREGGGRLEIMLRRDGSMAQRAFPIAHDRFCATGLEPGDYSVALQYRLCAHPSAPMPVVVPLTRASLRSGGTESIELDVTDAVPARISGSILVDREPLRDTDLFLRRTASPFYARIRMATDAHGDVHTLAPPGEYDILLVLPVVDGPGWVVLPIPGTRNVVRGRTNDISCQATRRHCRIRVMSATGEPIAFQRVTIVQSGYYRPGQIATDQNGWCEFGPVPSGEFTLECTDPRGRTSRARVTVPEVEGVAELTVQL